MLKQASGAGTSACRVDTRVDAWRSACESQNVSENRPHAAEAGGTACPTSESAGLRGVAQAVPPAFLGSCSASHAKCPKFVLLPVALLALLSLPSQAQEADFGISVPVTVSGGAMYTQRLQVTDPGESQGSGGFRAMLY